MRKTLEKQHSLNNIYKNKVFERLLHTSVYCLKKALEDCDSVLDLGCGPSSPLKNCNVKYAVGVDGFLPSIQASKGEKIHADYVYSDIKCLNFAPASFDAVILIEVLEHLPRVDGESLIREAESWAKRKVIISTPNGFFPQTEMDGNVYFKHLSGWIIKEMTSRGYEAHGLAGLKILRNESEGCLDHGLLSSIKFRPKILWLLVSEIFQLITYSVPSLSFEVFYVKKLGGNA